MKKSTPAASKSSPNASNYYNLHLAGFTPESLVDGEGMRATIFVLLKKLEAFFVTHLFLPLMPRPLKIWI